MSLTTKVGGDTMLLTRCPASAITLLLLLCVSTMTAVAGQGTCASPLETEYGVAPVVGSQDWIISDALARLPACCAACQSDTSCVQFYYHEEVIVGRVTVTRFKCMLLREKATTQATRARAAQVVTLKNKGSVIADPVINAFNGEKFYFSVRKGMAFNMLSAPLFALNGVLGTFASLGNETTSGAHNDEWITAIGARLNDTTITLTLNTESSGVETFRDEKGITRMRCSSSNMTALDLLHVEVGNNSANHMLGTGQTLHIADGSATVHFPAIHIGGQQPLLVLRTSSFEVTILLEDAASYHLDVDIKVLQDLDAATVHGVVGQTLSWTQDMSAMGYPSMASHIMDGDAEDYLIALNSLTGVDNKFSMFDKKLSKHGRKLNQNFYTLPRASWKVDA